MTAADITMYGVSQMRVRFFNPRNSAALTVSLKSDEGDVEITIFGLPEDRATHIAAALGDDGTIVFCEGRTKMPLHLYLETKDVFEALEGRKKENDHE